jgi:hypothetical protein
LLKTETDGDVARDSWHLGRDHEVGVFRLLPRKKKTGFGGVEAANPLGPTISYHLFNQLQVERDTNTIHQNDALIK